MTNDSPLQITREEWSVLTSFYNGTITIQQAQEKLGWSEVKIKVCAQQAFRNTQQNRHAIYQKGGTVSSRRKGVLTQRGKTIKPSLPTFSWEKDDKSSRE